MKFSQFDIGAFRIYAGALEASCGRYTSSIAIDLILDDHDAHRNVLLREDLSGGHRFPSAEAALAFALALGKVMVIGMPSADSPSHALTRHFKKSLETVRADEVSAGRLAESRWRRVS